MRRFKSLILSLSLIFFTFIAIPSAHAALGVSSLTSSPISSTGGGSGYTSTCTSPRVLSSLSSYTYPFDGSTALSYLTGNCATLAADGLTIATAGVQPQCGTLPNGASRALLGSTLGITTATYEDIACNAGSIAVGLNVRSGGILDTFGIQCAALTGSGQPIVVSSLGTSSKAYPYSQTLSMTVSGTLGSGAVTYAIAAGGTGGGAVTYSTATGSMTCTLSGSNLTAGAVGTCLVPLNVAVKGEYNGLFDEGLTCKLIAGQRLCLPLENKYLNSKGLYGAQRFLKADNRIAGLPSFPQSIFRCCTFQNSHKLHLSTAKK